MNPIIETLKNWAALPVDVKVVEEHHTFDVTKPKGINDPSVTDYSGSVTFECRFLQVGERKFPFPERPKAAGILYQISAGVSYPAPLNGMELESVIEEDGQVIFCVTDPPSRRAVIMRHRLTLQTVQV